ncbi:MAG: UDP-N-acetylmuramoyl-tripeptide--D-alanyl-D-alanine ligase [Acidobacteriota bacterium]|nr:UDP-N-acetylmuramoyl-tripeptide--D-alanyl-D-alanine ligase [Blastocatellia bacterium]MDW8412266.1 UDP-N-acetylmuramoyl-tripeptide--D-alanyl-D-alanine ligase [Acidobacteriota bacterium]
MRLAEVAEIIGSNLSPLLADVVPSGYKIDSRQISGGELFFAIRGQRLDGHAFVAEALERGAIAAVVEKACVNVPLEKQLIVQDTLGALQSLASAVIRRWGKPVVGITGSAGKTTTKELVALVLAARGQVLKSTGNLNNAYGLPLSILAMESSGSKPQDYFVAVLEMGMSSYGEIRRLCEIAPPTVAGVLNVGTAHIEFFGSQDAIAVAKAEIVQGIRSGGTALLNADDPRVAAMASLRPDVRSVFFGIESENPEVRAVDIVDKGVLGSRFKLLLPSSEAVVELKLAGRQLIYNALFAAAAGYVFGMLADEIAARLELALPISRRGQLIRLSCGAMVVDDSYNSSPDALEQAVSALAATPGFSRRIVVAGEMLELGEASLQLHRRCGQKIVDLGIDLLVGVQGNAYEMVKAAQELGLETKFFSSSSEAAEKLPSLLTSGDLILVKGSRGVRTELIVDALKDGFGVEVS